MKVYKTLCLMILIAVGFNSTVYSQPNSIRKKGVEIETRSLDELYEAALKEGGEFVLRAGGDKPDQIDYYFDQFKKRFPKLKVTHSVDVSLNHAPRFDNARAQGGKENVPDVIQFQTLHDFEYYKEHDLIIPYKPKNWDKVFPDHKDPNGYWTSMYGVTFTNYVNPEVLGDIEAPRDALDYLNPKLKGKIILTYPHDDDAVLYQFWQLKEQYGWEYLEKLVANEPTWVRGTAWPYVAINNGWYAASFTTFWAFEPFPNQKTQFLLPKEDYFLTWFQTAAIPTQAKNKAAAKLYMNWMLSEEMQGTWLQFPVRYDIKAPGGYESVLHQNTSPGDFRRWMMKRDLVERFRLQMRQLIGEAQGPGPVDIDYSIKPE